MLYSTMSSLYWLNIIDWVSKDTNTCPFLLGKLLIHSIEFCCLCSLVTHNGIVRVNIVLGNVLSSRPALSTGCRFAMCLLKYYEHPSVEVWGGIQDRCDFAIVLLHIALMSTRVLTLDN